ncbi:MAG TPA: hypothetical protein VMV86_01990, partial [Methanosarcinales archaeon]|nr:hypothetical protein [Methanosarcinales archaeon]
VVCGGAKGIDSLGKYWAEVSHVEVKMFKPEYEKWGRVGAPKIRNTKMAEHADALIAVWDGDSGGTKDMINKMLLRHKPVYIWIVGKNTGKWVKTSKVIW